MAEAEFDAVASTYVAQHRASIKLSGEDPDYFARYKIDAVKQTADAQGIAVRRILDFGTGIGNSLGPIKHHFPNAAVTALDVSDASLDQCRTTWGEAIDFRCYDGVTLPPDMGKFDLIFTSCVFHHIDERAHVALLTQIKNHLSKNGLFFLFEHNPWNPLTRHAVKTCPFDENAVLITAPKMRSRLKAAGFGQVQTDYRVFFPAFLATLRPLEAALRWLPFGAQYSLAAR